jgi:hypothetical protein
VLFASVRVSTATYDSSALIDDEGADTGVRRSKPYALAREIQRLLHKEFVVVAVGHRKPIHHRDTEVKWLKAKSTAKRQREKRQNLEQNTSSICAPGTLCLRVSVVSRF